MGTKNTRPEISIEEDMLYFLWRKADEHDLPRKVVYGVAMEEGAKDEEQIDERLQNI